MKNKKKYARLEGSLSFTEIAEKISEDGEQITPAKVRIIMLSVLEKIVRKAGIMYGKPISKKKARKIVENPNFQNDIVGLITEVYNS